MLFISSSLSQVLLSIPVSGFQNTRELTQVLRQPTTKHTQALCSLLHSSPLLLHLLLLLLRLLLLVMLENITSISFRLLYKHTPTSFSLSFPHRNNTLPSCLSAQLLQPAIAVLAMKNFKETAIIDSGHFVGILSSHNVKT